MIPAGEQFLQYLGGERGLSPRTEAAYRRDLERFSEELGRLDIEGMSLEAMKALGAYDWPGNVRELINVIERSVLLCEGKLITLDELPEEVAGPGAGEASARPRQ